MNITRIDAGVRRVGRAALLSAAAIGGLVAQKSSRPASNGPWGQAIAPIAVSALPAASTANANVIELVGNTTDCATTSGTVPMLCISTGSAWVPLGSGYPGAGIANSTGSGWGTSYGISGTGTVIPLANGATLTAPTVNGALTIGAGTGQFALEMKDPTVNMDTFGVPTFRSSETNSNTAMDIIPNGSPADSGVGLAWNDICDKDLLGAGGSQVTSCLHLSAGSSAMTVGSVAYGGAPIKPLNLTFGPNAGGTVELQLNNGYVIVPAGVQFGLGGSSPYASGGAIDIYKSSSMATEAAGLTIGTSIGAPEVLMGVDGSSAAGYLQSASRGTSFTAVPLDINPEGGAVTLGTPGHLLGVTVNGAIRWAGTVTVAALPACSSAVLGQRQLVSDAASATPGTAAAGNGSYTIAVECIWNSTGNVYSWIID